MNIHIEAEFFGHEEASVQHRGYTNTFIITIGDLELEVTPEHIAQILEDLGVDRESCKYPI